MVDDENEPAKATYEIVKKDIGPTRGPRTRSATPFLPTRPGRVVTGDGRSCWTLSCRSLVTGGN
ncbi:hypothetical protein [Streptomyces sp. NPDC001880]